MSAHPGHCRRQACGRYRNRASAEYVHEEMRSHDADPNCRSDEAFPRLPRRWLDLAGLVRRVMTATAMRRLERDEQR
jgi:hypothetical protein